VPGEPWDLRTKTVVVTGASSGIGRETAVALACGGAKVIITARDLERGQAALDEVRTRSDGGQVQLRMLDLASFASIHEFAAGLLADEPRLHVLVNNAGLVLSERLTTDDGLERTFGTNHVGPFLLTELLRPRIEQCAPGRIINVASIAHHAARRGIDFEDLQTEQRYSSLKAYSRSKLANILHARELARRLDGTGVTANALHPGAVASGFGRNEDTVGAEAMLMVLAQPFLISPTAGAATSVYLAMAPDVGDVSGQYYVRSKPARPSKAARDDEAAARLWEATEALVATSA
jgi:NAD(P)-dependent dehydrogenase (short-subunit alcohol dehydrogenase family)